MRPAPKPKKPPRPNCAYPAGAGQGTDGDNWPADAAPSREVATSSCRGTAIGLALCDIIPPHEVSCCRSRYSVSLAIAVPAQQPPAKPTIVAGRSKVATKYGIVAASQPLAAQAGVQILERGGNAIDAAIATNAVMGLVEPHYNGIGGDLFAIYYEAKTGKLYGLNAGGWAPTGLTPDVSEVQGHHAHAGQRHPHRDRAGRRDGLGDVAQRASASCRSRICSRRRFTTPTTDFRSPT